jgi:hypothetical protein
VGSRGRANKRPFRVRERGFRRLRPSLPTKLFKLAERGRGHPAAQGLSESRVQNWGAAVGIERHLMKPVDLDTIMDTIDTNKDAGAEPSA